MSPDETPPSPSADPDRRRRVLALSGGAVVLAAVVVAVLVLTSQSGDESAGEEPTTEQTTPEETSTVAEAPESPIDDLPQSGSVIGDPDAPVRIVEYGDLQCPACAAFSASVIPNLISGPVADGEASLEFRSFLIIGPQSLPASKAALAAGEQDRLWQFVEAFYAGQGAENSGYVTDEFLQGIAEQAGVPDMQKWEQDRSGTKFDAEIASQQQDAQRLGLSGTPSVLVQQGADGDPVQVESIDLESIEAAIADIG